MSNIPRTKILKVMQRRYDHVSARVVLKRALNDSGLASDCKSLTPEEVDTLCLSLDRVGDRLDHVIKRMRSVAGLDNGATERTDVKPMRGKTAAKDSADDKKADDKKADDKKKSASKSKASSSKTKAASSKSKASGGKSKASSSKSKASSSKSKASNSKSKSTSSKSGSGKTSKSKPKSKSKSSSKSASASKSA